MIKRKNFEYIFILYKHFYIKINREMESITDAVHTVWSMEGANITSLLLLDITRAFDNILYERLLYNLKVKGILIRIV